MKPRYVVIGACILSLAGLIAAALTVIPPPTVQVVPPPPIQVPGVPTVIQVAPGAPEPGPVLDTLPPLPVIDPPPAQEPAQEPAPAAQEPAPAVQEPAPVQEPTYQPCQRRRCWRRCG